MELVQGRRLVATTSPPERLNHQPLQRGGGQSRPRSDHEGSGVFLIVGIGASAGGLEAFKSFFSAMPANTGMAFVLVQHLSPDHKSMLAELLGRVTAMDVIEATDGVAVKPNCVFVIPPDATMTIEGGRLKIVKPAPPRDRRRPIDTFFQSLGEDQGESAVCVILSGTGSDGAQGLATVKEHGGLTLAQAEYDHHALPGMPESATNTGLVDEVLPVEAMPERIISYRAHLANVASGKDRDGVRHDAAPTLTSILRALHARTGHDFSEYKEKTLVRRLQRRTQVLGLETPEAYITRLNEHPEELDSLLRELLIGVTQFFRDPGAFDALNDTVLKGLVAGKGADQEIRVWVPGCATGEEAYTIAILLREAMDARRPRPKVQIFGTDLDDRAITTARVGRYRAPIAGLSPERTDRWFIVEGEDRCVVAEIREMCVFSVHSLIKHPPFSKIDLISCRNLLIYLDAPMQDRVMRTFHYGLKPNGSLFLGSSESVTRATKLFGVTDKKHRIFGRRDVPTAPLPPFAADRTGERPSSDPRAAPVDDRIDRSVRRLMEKHYPPHLVLDRANHIVRFSGGTVGQYLEPAPGAPSFALFDILRKSLRPAAREALQQVRSATEPVRRDDVPIRIDGKPRLVSLIAERLAEHGPDAEFVVLALHDAGPGSGRGKSSDAGDKSFDELQSVQQELRTTRTQLQSMINELETASEEMKSSNEEYQSVNEELQSSNEELETAKEEMQSINEELHTINGEMSGKNEQLTQLNSDMSNLLESTEIATLFLDQGLKIRRFTRGVSEMFHLRESDMGRPITDIVTLLDYLDLQRDVKTVLRKLSTIEREVTLRDAKTTFMLRIRPYRTVDNVIDGVVLTFIDITERQAAEAALHESDAQLKFSLKAAAAGSWDWHIPSGKIFWSPENYVLYDMEPGSDGPRYDDWDARVHPDDREQANQAVSDVLESRAAEFRNEFRVVGRDGTIRWLSGLGNMERAEDGSPVRLSGINIDITLRKVAESASREHDERQAYLLKLSDALRPISDPIEAQAVAMSLLGEYLGVTRAQYWEAEPDGEHVRSEGGYVKEGPRISGRVRLNDFGVHVIEALAAGETVAVGDVRVDVLASDDVVAAYDAVGVRAGLTVPLVKGGRIAALLGISHIEVRDWTRQEIALAEETAERTWAAVERASAEAALRAAHDTFRQLVDCSPFGIYAIDADFRLAQVSAGAQGVFENVHPAIGRDLAEVLRILWPEPFASEVIAHFRHTLATGEKYTEEMIEQRADVAVSEAYDWKLERIMMPDGRLGVVCHFYDLSERKRHEEHAQLLMAEVNHRAKNLLSVVQAVALQTAKSGDPLTFAARLSDRIGGLAANQDLLVKNFWHGVEVNELVSSQLAHFRDLIGTRIHLNGPGLTVTATASQAIGMAVHELATNAAKYGSLSNSNGQVRVEWQLTAGQNSEFSMSWRESDGPLVKAPTRNGFGQTVIKRLVETSVGGNVKVDHAEDGFSWLMRTAAGNVLVTSGGVLNLNNNAR